MFESSAGNIQVVPLEMGTVYRDKWQPLSTSKMYSLLDSLTTPQGPGSIYV